MREGAGEAKTWRKGALAPQGFLSLSDDCLTSTLGLVPTSSLLFPLSFCLGEQRLKAGHGESGSHRGTLASLPTASSTRGAGNEGRAAYAEGGTGGGLLSS